MKKQPRLARTFMRGLWGGELVWHASLRAPLQIALLKFYFAKIHKIRTSDLFDEYHRKNIIYEQNSKIISYTIRSRADDTTRNPRNV